MKTNHNVPTDSSFFFLFRRYSHLWALACSRILIPHHPSSAVPLGILSEPEALLFLSEEIAAETSSIVGAATIRPSSSRKETSLSVVTSSPPLYNSSK